MYIAVRCLGTSPAEQATGRQPVCQQCVSRQLGLLGSCWGRCSRSSSVGHRRTDSPQKALDLPAIYLENRTCPVPFSKGGVGEERLQTGSAGCGSGGGGQPRQPGQSAAAPRAPQPTSAWNASTWTGAGKGIGEATARLLARHGAAVVVCDIDESAAQTVRLTMPVRQGALVLRMW